MAHMMQPKPTHTKETIKKEVFEWGPMLNNNPALKADKAPKIFIDI